MKEFNITNPADVYFQSSPQSNETVSENTEDVNKAKPTSKKKTQDKRKRELFSYSEKKTKSLHITTTDSIFEELKLISEECDISLNEAVNRILDDFFRE